MTMSDGAARKLRPAGDGTPSGRVPPHSSEAEEAVLGGILLNNDAINIAIERLRPEDFYRSAHRSIFAAMCLLTDKREPIDIVTLANELKANNELERIGGMEALSSLASAVPSAANLPYYARVVREMSLRRRIIQEASEVVQKAFDIEGEVDEFIDIAEQKILGVAEQKLSRSFYRVGDVVQDSIKIIEKLYDQKEPVTGVPTGFGHLNEMTAGFQPSDLIILAARPSMGKTALALNFAQHIAVQHKKAVAVFSLEMSKEQLVLRMLCAEARVDSSKVRTGHLTERDFPRLVDAASRLAEAPIFIDDTGALPVSELRAKCRRLHREHPLSLVIVDYLQLMRSPAYSDSREQEIADISRSLKALAKELTVPVIALSQLNRSVESRTDKRPMMSDLRESGAIEQDADIIAFIYRDEVYHPDTADKGVAEILISKQRNGPTGVVRLAFLNQYTKFENLTERDEGVVSDGGGDGGGTSSAAANPFAALDDDSF